MVMKRNRMPIDPEEEWDAGPSPDEDAPPNLFDEGVDKPELWNEDEGE